MKLLSMNHTMVDMKLSGTHVIIVIDIWNEGETFSSMQMAHYPDLWHVLAAVNMRKKDTFDVFEAKDEQKSQKLNKPKKS